MVRYLRNALMAKLDGEQTELLQISGDERARAVRTALLFTEEELTRNLQIVLRAFDDLNYRQEQRFHLELGLLKLIHAQRLLPLEELLSGVAIGTQGGSASRVASGAARPAPSRLAAAAAPPAAPSISPFGSAGGSWNSGPANSGSKPSSSMRQSGGSVAVAEVERATPSPAPLSAAPSMEAVRHAVGCALADAGHNSAAQLLGTGAWTLDGASLRIEVPGVGKKMLALTVNGAAEKIVRQELQRLGAPTRFLVVPAEGAAQAMGPIAATAAPLAGSVQEAALANPLVQRAREVFKAEVRSVLDLRPK
jgi:DNA polymerase-3 subunit gamma/tau